MRSVSRAHAVVVTDAQGRVEYVNEAFVAMSGYTLVDMLGRSPGEVLQRVGTDPGAVATMRASIQSGQPCSGVELVNYRKDGSPYRVLLDTEPVRDDQGRVHRFVSVQTDITDQRHRETELHLLRQSMHEVRAVGLVGFWERDLATGRGRSDAQALRMLGLSEHAEAPSLIALCDLLVPESRPALERYQQALADGERSGLIEYAVRDAAGRVHDLVVHWSRVADTVVGVTVDVSGSRKAQDRRVERHTLLEQLASAAKLSTWVHDLDQDRISWMPDEAAGHPGAGQGSATGQEALEAVVPQDRWIAEDARRRVQEGDGMVEASTASPTERQCAMCSRAASARAMPTGMCGASWACRST